jgi:hypothetical protein
MKKPLLLAVISLAVYLASFQNLSSNSGGISGFAGSPADNGQTCTSCHGGSAQTVNNVITTDIPASGYLPGEIYNISISVTHPTFNRFGFSFSAQNPSNGNQLGTFNLTNTNETRLNAQGKYVGHTSGGTTGSANAKTWSFQWTAPATPQGDVGFYGAFNLTNGNGTTSGDATQVQSLIVQPNPSVGLSEAVAKTFKAYPNPVTQGFINLQFPAESGHVRLINLAGLVLLDQKATDGKLQLPTHLSRGFYLLELKANGKTFTQKIWVK